MRGLDPHASVHGEIELVDISLTDKDGVERHEEGTAAATRKRGRRDEAEHGRRRRGGR